VEELWSSVEVCHRSIADDSDVSREGGEWVGAGTDRISELLNETAIEPLGHYEDSELETSVVIPPTDTFEEQEIDSQALRDAEKSLDAEIFGSDPLSERPTSHHSDNHSLDSVAQHVQNEDFERMEGNQYVSSLL
jgi:hypothetical protein